MRRSVLAVLGLLVAVTSTAVSTYEVATHEELTGLAIDREAALLHARLIDVGLGGGLFELLRAPGSAVSRDARAWIVRGSNVEDNDLRPLHHFHNPLRPLNRAGLTACGPNLICRSSVRRLLDLWNDARRDLHDALTLPGGDARTLAMLRMLLTSGKLAHIVQDASVPAHTRDDPHVVLDALHVWVNQHRTLIPTFGVVSPPPGILAPRADGLLPAASLVDMDSYRYHTPGNPASGANRDVTLVDPIGLAEFANANFFSDDTVPVLGLLPNQPGPGADVPRPNHSDLSPPFTDATLPGGAYAYRSILRPSGEALVTHGLVERIPLDPQGVPVFGLPLWADAVHHDYARTLVPRSVGYSAHLLRYLFRGSMDVTGTDGATVNLTVTNTTPQDAMQGTFAVHYDAVGGRRQLAQSNLAVLAPAAGLNLAFPRPPDFTPGREHQYVVVFEGSLGAEQGAVVGKSVNVAVQPTLHLRLRTAFIEPPLHQQTVITSQPSGLSCSPSGPPADGFILETDCQARFPAGTVVEVTLRTPETFMVTAQIDVNQCGSVSLIDFDGFDPETRIADPANGFARGGRRVGSPTPGRITMRSTLAITADVHCEMSVSHPGG